MQYATSASVPVHKDLQQPRFIPFADTILGKANAVRDEGLLGSDLDKKLLETWDSYWMSSGEKKTREEE
jgi:hypothetical protein